MFFFFSAYYGDICVGSIACRLEKKEGGAIRVYIMTLGVLAPYRGLGIGKRAIYLSFDSCCVWSLFEKPWYHACGFFVFVLACLLIFCFWVSMLVDVTWSKLVNYVWLK